MSDDDSWISIGVDTDGDNHRDIIGKAAGPVGGVIVVVAVFFIVDLMVNNGRIATTIIETLASAA